MEDYDCNPPKKTTNTIIPNSKSRRTNKLYILTYNVRTLSSYGRLLELTEAIRNINFDIIGLSETRRLGTKIEEYENCILCHTGLTQGQYGVGFLINLNQKKNIESFIGISDRVALLNLNIQGNKMSLIQVYAPTEAAIEEEIELFYANLYKAMDLAHNTYIIMGDLNAKIGQPRDDEYLIMKPNGYGERNTRGQRLIDFALENKIAILNTFFKRKPNQRWTWRSPNGDYKNEIDYILSNRPGMVQNLDVLNLNFSSDHRPVRATITFIKMKMNRTGFKNNQNSTLKSEEEKNRYKECITAHLPNLLDSQENISVQTYHDKILKAITQSLKDARIPNKNINKRHKILSENTLELLERRQILQKTKNKTRSMKNELSALYKLISKRIKCDYRRYRLDNIEKHLAQSGSSKKAFRELRSNKTWIDGLSSKGKILNSRNDVIGLATDFYKTLYSAQEYENIDHNNTYRTDLNSSRCTPFDTAEVVQAIDRLKTNKSPGSDNITNEAIKSVQSLLALPLTHLFNRILETFETPTQWSESDIILIYKKGDPCDIANYRPISLLPSIYKLFSSLINQRISITLEAEQPMEQAGFRKSFSTIDHIHTLELLIEKYQEKQRALYIAFIDYKKAFDTVSHSSIWKSLMEQGVETVYIQIIKSIYRNNTGRVKLERVGPIFPIERGVRQGDPISPKLFIAILESIIRKLDWKTSGLNIDGIYLSHLRFADDLVLLSESSSQLQFMIQSLNVASKEVGLEMNLTKTMLMTNNTEKIIISVDNEILKYTNKYIYLGKQISFDKESNYSEIERRIQLTWNKYWSLKEIFKSNMPVKIKSKVMSSCLLPCLTYACQTWKYTAKIKKKIITCQRGLERSMLKIKKIQKIRHTKIRNISKATDALNYAQKLKWKWAGHVARLSDERWTKRVTLWRGPSGKRQRGRPLTRWADDINKTAGPDWLQTAQVRENWASLEEAFTCGGVLAD